LEDLSNELPTPYHFVVLHIIPRILTNLDRDPDSPTYGCFDRNYWHYKVHDYSSGLLQQSMLSLCLVYSYDFKDNIYYNNRQILNYTIAAIDFCTKIQHSDGSFDEYWAGERSIPSTAFTLYAICETCDRLNYLPENVVVTIKKAVGFLRKHPEKEALNQEVASIAAISYASKLLGDDEASKLADSKFETLLGEQKKEGWFSEYGGLDVGYLTVNLDYMIRYYEITHNERALGSAKKMLNIIKYFVHPDGSFGGEYCTRNTEYFVPYGMEYLRDHCDIAKKIICKLMQYINRDSSYLNLSLDERYILHYVNPSYVKSLLIYKDDEVCKEKLPYENDFEKHLEEAHIYVKSNKCYYFICNISKGGVFKVFDKTNLQFSTDCGYRLSFDGHLYVNEWPDNNEFVIESNYLQIKSNFLRTKMIKQSSVKLLALRVLSKLLGYKMIPITKKILIFNKGSSDMILTRRLNLNESTIVIIDSFDVGNRIVQARSSSGLSVRHTASSRFFQISSLNNMVKDDLYHVNGKETIERNYTFS